MRNYIRCSMVAFVMVAFLACGGSGSDSKTVKLFGTVYPGGGVDSILVMLSPDDGSFLSTIGPVTGYSVTGLEYDATENVLYGTSRNDDLLEIDMDTGAAMAVTPGPGTMITRPTVDSTGFMVAWSPEDSGDDELVVVDKDTGEIDGVGNFGFDEYFYEHGLAFDNDDTLYIIDGGGTVWTIGRFGNVSLKGDIGTRAHHGDFHPETGHYWGIDGTNDASGPPRHLLVVDVNAPAVMDSLATVDYLSGVTFYYD